MKTIYQWNSDFQVSEKNLQIFKGEYDNHKDWVSLHHCCKNGMYACYWFVVCHGVSYTFFDIRETLLKTAEALSFQYSLSQVEKLINESGYDSHALVQFLEQAEGSFTVDVTAYPNGYVPPKPINSTVKQPSINIPNNSPMLSINEQPLQLFTGCEVYQSLNGKYKNLELKATTSYSEGDYTTDFLIQATKECGEQVQGTGKTWIQALADLERVEYIDCFPF